jgi:hypothetical protein
VKPSKGPIRGLLGVAPLALRTRSRAVGPYADRVPWSKDIPVRDSQALRVLTTGLRLLPIMRHSGTNGWLSSWGTNAHGEIAGCPPAAILID